MRIGIEAQRIFRQKKHGMDIVAIELIRRLQKIDAQNQYFIFAKPGKDRSWFKESKNFKVVEIGCTPYPVWEQICLPLKARGLKLNFLHCTANTAPLFTGSPTIITLHDIIFLEKNKLNKGGTLYQRAGNWYRKFIVPPALNKSNKIITVSHSESETILKHNPGIKGKISVIYNSVGEHFREESSERIKSFKDRYNLPEQYILLLGNTAPKKNIKNAIRAYHIYQAEHKQSTPLVITDYSEKNLVKVLRSLDLSHLFEKIYLPGYIQNTEMPVLMSGAVIFLYPSIRESFGIPILEAMACGTPVITSNISCMPEIAGDAAMLANPYDPEDIAIKINSLLNDSVLHEKKRNMGFRRIKRFSWENSARELLSIYEEPIY